jgi:NAD(P)-dependent dehydrogenase (short-subunit alcohol dehydrogenase family)
MNILDRFCLRGKKAIVTGGAQGIGLNYAIAMAGAGADVAIADLNGGKAKETAEFLAREYGVQTMSIQADVTSPEQVQDMCDQMAEKMGRIDIAFCNAGISINVPAEEMTYEQWRKVIDINLTGVKIHDPAGRRLHNQYRFHVRPYREYPTASGCLQCVEGRGHHADKISGRRMGR